MSRGKDSPPDQNLCCCQSRVIRNKLGFNCAAKDNLGGTPKLIGRVILSSWTHFQVNRRSIIDCLCLHFHNLILQQATCCATGATDRLIIPER